MTLKDDLKEYDQAERLAFVNQHEAHPEWKIDELLGRIADDFRPRWHAILRAAEFPIGSQANERATSGEVNRIETQAHQS